MSHHISIYIGDSMNPDGHVRIRNDGTILSIWIKTDKQQMLFLPESPDHRGEEE